MYNLLFYDIRYIVTRQIILNPNAIGMHGMQVCKPNLGMKMSWIGVLSCELTSGRQSYKQWNTPSAGFIFTV